MWPWLSSKVTPTRWPHAWTLRFPIALEQAVDVNGTAAPALPAPVLLHADELRERHRLGALAQMRPELFDPSDLCLYLCLLGRDLQANRTRERINVRSS